MLVMRATENPANPLGKLVGAEQPLELDHLALAVDPLLGLYGVQPRALLGQQTAYDPHSSFAAALFDLTRLCFPSQRLTSLEMCQLALSQMRSRTFLPRASSFSQLLHWRNRVVIPLTGPPSTNLIHVWSQALADRARNRRGPSDRDRLFRPTLLEEAHRLSFLGPELLRVGKASPGSTSTRPRNPLPTRNRPRLSSSVGRGVFFLSYRGSGEVIHRLALCQRTPRRRAKVAWIVSPEARL